jgi:hypothetical protein
MEEIGLSPHRFGPRPATALPAGAALRAAPAELVLGCHWWRLLSVVERDGYVERLSRLQLRQLLWFDVDLLAPRDGIGAGAEHSTVSSAYCGTSAPAC